MLKAAYIVLEAARQSLAIKMQGKAAYNRSIVTQPLLDPTHCGSFAHQIYLLKHILCRCRYIKGTSAHSGCGLYEGLDWLFNNVSNKAESFSYNHIPHIFSHINQLKEIDLTHIEIEKDIVAP